MVKERFLIKSLADEICESFSTKKPLTFNILGDAALK